MLRALSGLAVTIGLHKYDGYKFTLYTHDKNDSSSISNSSIKDIHTDHKGRLWIGTKLRSKQMAAGTGIF